MAGAPTLTERYARALARMHSSQAHEARAHVGNLTLQIGLAAEILQRAQPADPEARARLERCLDRARSAIRDVHGALERLLAQTDLDLGRGPLDLGQALRKVGELLAPFLEGRRLAWRLAVPEHSVAFEGDRVALWQAMVVAAVEAAETMAPGEALEIALDGAGRWVTTGPRSGEWVAPLREVIEAHGGEVLAGPSRLEIRLPTGARR